MSEVNIDYSIVYFLIVSYLAWPLFPILLTHTPKLALPALVAYFGYLVILVLLHH